LKFFSPPKQELEEI